MSRMGVQGQLCKLASTHKRGALQHLRAGGSAPWPRALLHAGAPNARARLFTLTLRRQRTSALGGRSGQTQWRHGGCAHSVRTQQQAQSGEL